MKKTEYNLYYAKKVIRIINNIIGAALTFLGGAAVAAICYLISKAMLKKRAEQLPSMQIVRQLIQIGYLAAIFLIARFTPCDTLWLLLGGCVGITLPMFYFTYRLVKFNDSMKKEREEEKKNG